MNNPYKNLGVASPFGLFGINFMIAEAFKKCACAGINGRAKTTKQDLKEARATIVMAMSEHKDGKRFYPVLELSLEEIESVIACYQSTFNFSIGLMAARQLLLYAREPRLSSLEIAVKLLDSESVI